MATSQTVFDMLHSSPLISGDHRESSHTHPSLRRDKPQLSCSLCRKRKVRCNRQTPCATCSRRGVARFCVYGTETQESIPPRSGGTVHERIHQLESLVISLLQQDKQSVAHATNEGLSISDPPQEYLQVYPETALESHSLTTYNLESATPSEPLGLAIDILPIPLDSGCMKFNSLGMAKYVGSSHWAAVLDSISELKEHFEQEEEIRNITSEVNKPDPISSSWPNLLYSNPWVTKAEILSSIPSRQVADRLVSRYFALDIACGVLHTGQFLREYEYFWEDQTAVPIMWIGLLFTILCLGELHRHSIPPFGISTLDSTSVNIFRGKIVDCLMLGRYTDGGPHVLECLIQYNMIEHFLRQDADFEIWILLGMLIPIALRMGLHRDPDHFSEITPFAGEMRRRLWATIFQIDVGFSALVGLPRVIKPQQCDTEEPRNLLDTDFDEDITELPKSRPESEVTPVLFLLAKSRIISVGGLISDLAHDVRLYPYSELMRFENLLLETRNSLPSSLKWQPLSTSILQGPQAIMQRVYLEMVYHKMRIILYKKYLAASMTQPQYIHARQICLDSAVEILKYQHMIHDEMEVDGRLSSVHWTYSLILNHDFIFAASILCFYINRNNKDMADQETRRIIESLLRTSSKIWHGSESNEAQRAARSLSIILGIQE